MKTSISALLAVAVLTASLGVAPAFAASPNDKIDPPTYVCAELVAAPGLSPEPPLFPALQLDGWASAEIGSDVASPDTVMLLVGQVYQMCLTKPADSAYAIWKKLREAGPEPLGTWNARKSTCRDYAENTEDGSGFIIWLDAYNRKAQGTKKSILKSDKDVQRFIDACLRSPDRTMLEVLREKAR